MELTLNEAEARLSEIVTAAQNGERVVITRDGEPAVELSAAVRNAAPSTSTSLRRTAGVSESAETKSDGPRNSTIRRSAATCWDWRKTNR